MKNRGEKQKVEYRIETPAVRINTKIKQVYDMTQYLIDNGLFPSTLYTLLFKLSKDPNILSIKESTTDIKISKTISGLEAIASVLKTMQESQTKVQSNLNDSITLLKALTDRLNSIENQNSLQHQTITKIFDILSSSTEGLEMLNKITEQTNINFQEIIEQSQATKDDNFMEEVGEKLTELQASNLVFSNSAVGLGEFDDEDDLLGSDFDQDELAEVVRKLKGD